jgi:N-acylglucosamine-6-phosphate 2-epimerase
MNKPGFDFAAWLTILRSKLVVSCQALPDEPLYGPDIMARMAVAAWQGGAVAIRANTPEDICAIRAAVSVPIIGLWKDHIPGYDVYITPTLEDARSVAEAGADIISIDATLRPHPHGLLLAEFIRCIKELTGCCILADISTIEEALLAEESGADMIASTLSGYTPYSPQIPGPDLALVEQMTRQVRIPCLAEGRYNSPEMAVEALRRGAYAVIVGGAITRPAEIASRFSSAFEAFAATN